jgi:hypothetical protein
VAEEKGMASAITAVDIAILVAATAFGRPASGSKPVLDPSQGDGGVSAFYVWDKEVPGTPGKLLRQEPLPENLMLAKASKGLRVLYTSTNGIDGKTPITVSGAVYFPKGKPPSGGWPVVAWGHGHTGVADVCAPSWAPQRRRERDVEYLNAWLAEGFAIAATDYQGLGTPGGHPWGVLRAEGYSLIDSARSAIAAFPELSDTAILIGQSQGSRAVLSASLFAHHYARSFKFKGTVATGVAVAPPFSLETKAPQIRVPPRTGGGANARLAVESLFRFLALDRGFHPADYLNDAAKPAFEASRTGCSASIEQAVAENGLTTENVFKKDPTAAVANAEQYLRFPRTRFAHPVFIGTGLDDITEPPQSQYNFIMAACHEGSTVEAHYYPGKDHSGAVNASLVDSIPFVKKILAGQRVASNCDVVRPPPSTR